MFKVTNKGDAVAGVQSQVQAPPKQSSSTLYLGFGCLVELHKAIVLSFKRDVLK